MVNLKWGVYFPAVVFHNVWILINKSPNMKQLLRNASDINTSAAKAPGRATVARRHIVENSHRKPELSSFLGESNASSPSSEHNNIVNLIFSEWQPFIFPL